jgi:DNA polymerase-3 subunit epsilon
VEFAWSWFRRKKHPSIAANHALCRRFDKTKPVEAYRFVSVDTELTGFNVRRDAIVSIGAVRIEELRIVVGDNFLSYVRPKRSLPKTSTLIHRITPDQLEDAPELKRTLPDFADFVGSDPIVGHFIALDMGFINRASKRLLHGPLKNSCLDTMKLAKVYHDKLRGEARFPEEIGGALSLTALSGAYGLPSFDQHDALGDAFQAACLFIFLVKRLQRMGCVTLKDFLQITRGFLSAG